MLDRLTADAGELSRRWNRFWFEPADLWSLGLFRCLIASVAVVMYTDRWRHFDLYLGENGMVTFDSIQRLLAEPYTDILLLSIPGDGWAYLAHGVFLVLLAGLALGVFGRSLTWVVWLLHLSFLHRNPAIMYGADMYLNFWFFYLSWTRHHRHFSILNLMFSERSTRLRPDVVSHIGFRFLQVQLIVSYVFSGLEKLKGPAWWDGTAVWQALSNTQINPYDFGFLAQVPWLVALLTLATLLYEIFGAFFLWSDRWRIYVMAFGVAFHLSIAVAMGLVYFGLILAASVLLFARRSDWSASARSVGTAGPP
jgi:hypothetical protein